MAAQTTTAFSMKLFIDTTSRRVLFAETGKDVADFLLSLLDLPLAAAVALVGAPFAAGSAGSLYYSDSERFCSVSSPAASLFIMPPSSSSFEPSRTFFRCKHNYAGYGDPGISINHCYLYMTDVGGSRCPNCLSPMTATLQRVSSSVDSSPPWSPYSDPTTCFSSSPVAPSSSLAPSRIYFRCVHQYSASRVRGGCNLYMADVKGTACPNCGNPMTETLYYVSPVWSGLSNPTQMVGEGSVQDQEAAAATYTVSDDLRITPPNTPVSGSGVSTATRLSRLGITDLGAVQERTVRLTYIKGVQILKALLQSKTVLTDVFLGKVH